MTGLFRKAGINNCSTDAKNASASMCKMVR
jgi:hypothetical protein